MVQNRSVLVSFVADVFRTYLPRGAEGTGGGEAEEGGSGFLLLARTACHQNHGKTILSVSGGLPHAPVSG